MDLKIAHLNIYVIRDKIDELRVLQSICGLDIIAITETYLDSSISNNPLHIDGMNLFRQDRKKCKGGGCIMFCAEHLPTTIHKDLASKDLEAIWVQIKFRTTSVLFSVIYRSEQESPNFFLWRSWESMDEVWHHHPTGRLQLWSFWSWKRSRKRNLTKN